MLSPQSNQHEGHAVDRLPSLPRRSTHVWLLAALSATAVYLPTMAPGVLWGDSGDAQLRVLTGAWCDSGEIARSHVTYYAVAIAVHKAFCLDAAIAANLVAALAGVITVANAAWLMSLVVRRRLALVCGTALLLFSHTLWQLSTGAEVVTFSTMLLSLELVMVLRFLQTHRLRWLALAALVNGLGWSTHNFAMLMWPAYLMTVLWRPELIPRPRARSLAITACAWLAGCVPLVVLIVLEYQRLGDVGLTMKSLFVGSYARRVFNVHLTVGLLLRLVGFAVLCFPTPLVLLAPWGWIRLRASAPPGAWLFLTVAAASYTAFAARYTVPDQYTFMVHSYVFLVFFVAVGAEHWLCHHPLRAMQVALVALSLTGPLAYAVGPPLARRYAGGAVPFPKREIPYREPYNWFLRPWRVGYRGAETYAREVLEALPEGAVLLADSTIRRPLDYLQGRDGFRLDVRLPNTPFPRPWQQQMEVGPENAGHFIEQGLLFCTTNVPGYYPLWLANDRYRLKPQGHVYRVEGSVSLNGRNP